VPAAAVIPAPIAYIKVVAVKTLVVEILVITMGYPFIGYILIVIIINPFYVKVNTFICSEVLL
jgi:hypothetical protein